MTSTTDEDWIARERRLLEEKALEERRAREAHDRDIDKSVARLRAIGCVDPGNPERCLYCATVITYDSLGRPMHPANACEGPTPAPCAECHTPYVWNATRLAWEPGCTPAEHDALRSTRRIVQIMRTADAGTDPLSLGRAARQRGT